MSSNGLMSALPNSKVAGLRSSRERRTLTVFLAEDDEQAHNSGLGEAMLFTRQPADFEDSFAPSSYDTIPNKPH